MPAELNAIGRYTIEGVLGKGAMGTVDRALDTTLRRAVALKVLDEGGPLSAKKRPHDSCAKDARQQRFIIRTSSRHSSTCRCVKVQVASDSFCTKAYCE